MSDFITTSGGCIINLDAVAFLSTRPHPKAKQSRSSKGARVSYVRKDLSAQLLVSFSAAAGSTRSMTPLSLVFEGDEAIDLLDQLASRDLDTARLREDLTPAKG